MEEMWGPEVQPLYHHSQVLQGCPLCGQHICPPVVTGLWLLQAFWWTVLATGPTVSKVWPQLLGAHCREALSSYQLCGQPRCRLVQGSQGDMPPDIHILKGSFQNGTHSARISIGEQDSTNGFLRHLSPWGEAQLPPASSAGATRLVSGSP